jgi:magnesium chelatase family protein
VPYRELVNERISESSHKIRKRVIKARKIQEQRFEGQKIYCNANMGAREIRHFSGVGARERAFLDRVLDKMGLSARSYHRILKIARTIADLENALDISVRHLSEAVQYRSFDRNIG